MVLRLRVRRTLKATSLADVSDLQKFGGDEAVEVLYDPVFECP